MKHRNLSRLRNNPFSGLLLLCVVSLIGHGCSDEESTTSDDVTNPNNTPDETDTSGMRTLASCTTSISDDAPAFYKTYFRCVTITMDGDTVVVHTQDLPPHQSPWTPSPSEFPVI